MKFYSFIQNSKMSGLPIPENVNFNEEIENKLKLSYEYVQDDDIYSAKLELKNAKKLYSVHLESLCNTMLIHLQNDPLNQVIKIGLENIRRLSDYIRVQESVIQSKIRAENWSRKRSKYE